MIEQPQNPTLPIHGVTSNVFCSDNLELMKTIESNTINLIYCDILYGTGRKFTDYKDLKPIRSEIETHYIPRIKEMHRILKPTGSIYLQMDTKINHWMRCIMDDIFGYDNFVNEVIWSYNKWSIKQKAFAKNHDILIFYGKTDKIIFNELRLPLETPRKKNKVDVKDGKKVMKRDENGVVVYKIQDSTPIDDVWELNNLGPTNSERLGYDTQKPKALIERIIKASSNEGDLVADFYLGSGTTAEVCKELNRNFIGCDINPRAVEITLQRLNDALS